MFPRLLILSVSATFSFFFFLFLIPDSLWYYLNLQKKSCVLFALGVVSADLLYLLSASYFPVCFFFWLPILCYSTCLQPQISMFKSEVYPMQFAHLPVWLFITVFNLENLWHSAVFQTIFSFLRQLMSLFPLLFRGFCVTVRWRIVWFNFLP